MDLEKTTYHGAFCGEIMKFKTKTGSKSNHAIGWAEESPLRLVIFHPLV